MTELSKYLPAIILVIVAVVIRVLLRRQGRRGGAAALLAWLRGRREPATPAGGGAPAPGSGSAARDCSSP